MNFEYKPKHIVFIIVLCVLNAFDQGHAKETDRFKDYSLITETICNGLDDCKDDRDRYVWSGNAAWTQGQPLIKTYPIDSHDSGTWVFKSGSHNSPTSFELFKIIKDRRGLRSIEVDYRLGADDKRSWTFEYTCVKFDRNKIKHGICKDEDIYAYWNGFEMNSLKYRQALECRSQLIEALNHKVDISKCI